MKLVVLSVVMLQSLSSASLTSARAAAWAPVFPTMALSRRLTSLASRWVQSRAHRWHTHETMIEKRFHMIDSPTCALPVRIVDSLLVASRSANLEHRLTTL